jgi:hypothetical protein
MPMMAGMLSDRQSRIFWPAMQFPESEMDSSRKAAQLA